mgnify:CR=1 FL=1
MCLRPITLKNDSRKPHNDRALNTVPCGRCYKCVQKNRTEWAFRLFQESKDHAYSYFLTLTYSTKNLPFLNLTTGEYPVRLKNNCDILAEEDQIESIVYKKDVQDFIKNVRRQQEYHTTYSNPIRYYATSEYGTKQTQRPHYHVILYSLHPDIAKKIELQKIWPYGQAQIKPMDRSVKTYYYVTKYLFKQRNYDIWTFRPFTLMSTKPFLGNRYLETSKQYHFAKGDLITRFNGRDLVIPRIYADKLPTKLKENTYEKIKQLSHEKHQKSLRDTHHENYHPSILNIWKQMTQEQNFNQELNDFKQLFHEYF